MPLGGKALKKRQQNADEKAGIVRDQKVLYKQSIAKADVVCAFCATTFKVTKKNIDQRNHAESKHPKNSFDECFPTLAQIEADDKVAESAAAAVPEVKKAPKKKKDDMSLLAEGLAGANIKSAPKKKK
mmetsp:Transcript_6126/g.7926  ORF Transcript_6126/g.7926 Transcript_6126/m.7926 type:complete len:128 (-) Transcript_6126:141-524(-)|eukprot:CAMPEP_0114360184 /NCGR_PEP_ID=MMETSP0101-20121206/23641_1 /TAXON_ID=38822 ORGANISM="Pteridomonas danica, Strain PT" /NCGR_SAMPLE_ID=MMETSP0101 /ASSEMBLY_ACC=CAM_ASM_000211 /LENGTH=127 /DNA_ID=CAMNT_0001504229 /DNA_START=1 /DNA_END=384 /DNA_ORIENTATION=+